MIAILHDDGALRLGAERNLLIGVWREAPTLAQLVLVNGHAKKMAAEHDGVGYINAILSGSGKFPPEVRAEVARHARDASVKRLGVAHLVLLPGWQGPAARAFVRAAITLAHSPAPNKVFRDDESCAKWMASQMNSVQRGEGFTSSNIVDAYRSIAA